MLLTVLTGIIIGIIIVIGTPIIASTTSYRDRIANWYWTIGMQTLRKPTITISKQTDLELTSRTHNDQHDRQQIGSDPPILLNIIRGSMMRAGGRSVTFVDRHFGVSFNLRYLSFFQRLTELQNNGRLRGHIWTNDGVQGFHRAVCQLSNDGRTLDMDLDASIRRWTDGNEDGTAWHRVREGVRRMFIVRGSRLAFLKLLLPVISLVGALFASYYLFGPGQLPGGPNVRTVAPGAGTLLLGILGLFGDDPDDDPDDTTDDRDDGLEDSDADDSESDPAIDLSRRQLAIGTGIIATLTLAVVLGVAAPGIVVTTGIAATVAIGTIISIIILSTGIISSLSSLRDGVGALWVTLAFQGLETPTIYQTATDELVLTDGRDLETKNQYRLCNTLVAFDCDVSPDAWDDAAVRPPAIEDMRSISAIQADGGHDVITDVIGSNWTPAQVQNGNIVGVVPSMDSVGTDGTWIRTDRIMSHYADASTGRISERAQQEAVKEFADGSSAFSDTQLMIYSVVAAGLGFIGGALFWGILM